MGDGTEQAEIKILDIPRDKHNPTATSEAPPQRGPRGAPRSKRKDSSSAGDSGPSNAPGAASDPAPATPEPQPADRHGGGGRQQGAGSLAQKESPISADKPKRS